MFLKIPIFLVLLGHTWSLRMIPVRCLILKTVKIIAAYVKMNFHFFMKLNVESGNRLVSYKGVQKIGALYLSFEYFPSHLNSCLKNIFIVSLFHSGSNQHLQSVLERLRQNIDTLNQNGIVLMDQLHYFKFCGFLRDNLGLHQILGFSQSL